MIELVLCLQDDSSLKAAANLLLLALRAPLICLGEESTEDGYPKVRDARTARVVMFGTRCMFGTARVVGLFARGTLYVEPEAMQTV